MNQPDPDATQRGPAPGQRVFGRYVLESVRGRGGMGVVWRARDELLGETVALKFLPDAVRWDPAAFEDLKAETRRARQLTHPNIIRIHDFVEDASGAAISMEFVDGVTLTELRMGKPGRVLGPEEIRAWLPQLCGALDYAHGQAKVVHRDLKPSNVMLTRDGVVKVGDFGIARSLADSITRVSMMSAGTLIYMSPQQAMGEEPAATDDIYSLGAMLYELLAGRPPFHTGDVRAQLFQRKPERIAGRRAAALAEWRSQGTGERPAVTPATWAEGGNGTGDGNDFEAGIPAAWEETIAACLEKEATRRPGSAGAVGARLSEGATTRPWRRGWRGVRLKRPKTRVLVGAAALGVLVLLAGWQFGTGWRPLRQADAGMAWPSDATRAWAAWNFDGNGAEATGRGTAMVLGAVVPTFDRFGRVDRALHLGGISSLLLDDLALRPLVDGTALSLSIWVKPKAVLAERQTIFAMNGRQVGEIGLALAIDGGGRGLLKLGQRQVEGSAHLWTNGPLAVETWTHLAVVCRGTEAELWLNGQLQERQKLSREAQPGPTERVWLRLGTGDVYHRDGFVGTMDELRVWRRALDEDEIRRMAQVEAPPRFVPSNRFFSERDDLPAKVVEDLGADATLADWNDLARWHRDDIDAWCEEVGFPALEENLLLQRGGNRWSEAPRHYMIDRFRGTKPDYYLAHDEMGGMQIALGSWHGITARALVRMPPAKPRTETLVAGAAGEVVRELRENEATVALGLDWQQALPTNGSAAVVRLRLRDGEMLVARIEALGMGRFALALGEAARPQLARQFSGSVDDYRFTVVARDGILRFRAVIETTGVILFQEEVRISGMRIGHVTEVRLSGPDRATWVVE